MPGAADAGARGGAASEGAEAAPREVRNVPRAHGGDAARPKPARGCIAGGGGGGETALGTLLTREFGALAAAFVRAAAARRRRRRCARRGAQRRAFRCARLRRSNACTLDAL